MYLNLLLALPNWESIRWEVYQTDVKYKIVLSGCTTELK